MTQWLGLTASQKKSDHKLCPRHMPWRMSMSPYHSWPQFAVACAASRLTSHALAVLRNVTPATQRTPRLVNYEPGQGPRMAPKRSSLFAYIQHKPLGRLLIVL